MKLFLSSLLLSPPSTPMASDERQVSVELLKGYGWGNYHIDVKKYNLKYDFEESQGYDTHTDYIGYYLLPNDGVAGPYNSRCRFVARICFSGNERILVAELWNIETNSVKSWTQYEVHGNWPTHRIVAVGDSTWNLSGKT